MPDLTWVEVGLAALMVLSWIGCLLIYTGWSENRRDERLGIPTRRRPKGRG